MRMTEKYGGNSRSIQIIQTTMDSYLEGKQQIDANVSKKTNKSHKI
jgi:hypothetical protein